MTPADPIAAIRRNDGGEGGRARHCLDFHAGDRGTLAGPDAVRGGVQDVWTVGLNWYLNANFRMSLNYYHVDVDRLNPASLANPTPFGAAPNTPPTGVQIGQEYDVIGLRSQFNF